MADSAATPPLREYGERLITYRLRLLADLVLDGWGPTPLVRRFSDRLQGPDFVHFLAGFLVGFWHGGRERLDDWTKDTETTLVRLKKLLIDEAGRVKIGRTIETGIATGLWEFFARRKLSDEVIELGKISPAAAEAVDQLQLLHELEPIFTALAAFEEQRRATSFLAELGDIAESIIIALVNDTSSQLRLILEENDTEVQGERVGKFVGSAIVELVRCLAEPPSLTLVELVSLLALDGDEMNQLGIGTRP
jgi:hypothetical protein